MTFHPVMTRRARCSSSRSSPPRAGDAHALQTSCKPVPEEVRRAADLLERRWTLSILYALARGRRALQRVPARRSAASRRARSPARLTELDEAGLLERRVLDTRPPRSSTALTREGRAARLRSSTRWNASPPSSSSRSRVLRGRPLSSDHRTKSRQSVFPLSARRRGVSQVKEPLAAITSQFVPVLSVENGRRMSDRTGYVQRRTGVVGSSEHYDAASAADVPTRRAFPASNGATYQEGMV